MAQTFNTILSFVKSTSRKDRRKGVGSLSVSAGGGVGSVADSATQPWVRNNFVDKTTEQEISALKIFSQGIKIGDVSLFKHPDGYVYLDETLVLKGGVVMYGNSSGVEVPSIFESLPIDRETIKRDGNGALYVDETALKISGGGGGVADSVYWNNVIGKPSWIGSTKPSYKYSEIEEKPDLSEYFLKSSFTKANIKSTLGISDWALASVKPTYKYSEISNTPDLSVYALNTDLGKKWTQNDAKIANWDSAYSWGNHANAGYAKASDVTNEFKNYVKLAGDAQSITAQHNFANGLKIGGLSLRKVDDYLYLDSSLVLSGGVTMYGDDGTTVKPIWESIPFDRTTIDWVNGKWTVVGGVGSGGISEEFLNVKLQEYQPLLSTTNKLPYSLISGTPDLSGYALASAIPTNNNQLTNGAGYITASALNGYATQSWVNTALAGYLPKSGGIISTGNPSPIVLDNNDPNYQEVGVKITIGGIAKGWIGYTQGKGLYLYTYSGGHTLGINDSGKGFVDNKTIAFTSDIPTKLSQLTDDVVAGKYLPLAGGTISGDLDINSQKDTTIRYFRVWYYGEGRKNRGMIRVNENNVALSYYSPTDGVYHPLTIGRDGFKYNTYDILHSGNYSNLLAGGTINGSLTATSFIGNLTGNAASATKLSTARTIWGQSFDGTGDITGDLTIPNNNSIKVKSSGGVVYSVLKMSTANSLSIGQESASNGRTTMIYGNLIRLRCGTGGTDALYVNESGNVTIGTSDLAGATNKMYVDGTAKFTGDTTFSSKVVIGTIPVYESADGTLFVDANVVFRGGVAMYGNTTTTINEE